MCVRQGYGPVVYVLCNELLRLLTLPEFNVDVSCLSSSGLSHSTWDEARL